MIYRKIKEGEAKAFANLSSIAFFGNADDAYKDIEKGEFLPDTIRVLEDENGRISAGLRLFDIEMFLDTGYVRTGGIGDVSSYPENRRKGNVSELFDGVLKEMYEDDYVLSYLYPFSHPFYRKYGYELCIKKDIVTFKAEGISYKKDWGYAKMHVPGSADDLSDEIKQVYEKYAQGMNFMLNRKGWFWDRILKGNPFTSKSRLYVLYYNDGTPAAYFQYDYEKIDFITFNAKIFDMAFISSEAFDMMVNFMYKLTPQIKDISFSCPPVIDAYSIIEEPWHVNIKSDAGGMMRIINAQKALCAIKAPEMKAKLNIRIFDDNIEHNNNIFTVDIESGRAAAQKAESTTLPDMECSIHALNQLVSGYAGLEQAKHRKDIKINSNYEIINKVFVKKPIHTQDHF